jgi:hypothetical protein
MIAGRIYALKRAGTIIRTGAGGWSSPPPKRRQAAADTCGSSRTRLRPRALAS